MTWISTHSWIIPLVITVAAAGLFVWFLLTAKGDDIMGGPPLFAFCISLAVLAWAAWGAVKFVMWLV